ncbi:MAG: hypothetical protein H7X86_07095 [Gorillibacterium sp.]|nr:hypothetical protein [Gorillibacterium sp.]
MSNYSADRQKVLVQNNAETLHAYKSMCSEMKHLCERYINQPVRVQTLNGQIHEGTIAHVDDSQLYLYVSKAPVTTRAYPYSPYPYPPYPPVPYPNYNNMILPLALFDLLVLTLLL